MARVLGPNNFAPWTPIIPKLKNKLGFALAVAEPKDKELVFQTLLGKEKTIYYIPTLHVGKENLLNIIDNYLIPIWYL